MISVRHDSGGLFRATFIKLADSNLFKFIDEGGNVVETMMEEPAMIAYINRLTT